MKLGNNGWGTRELIIYSCILLSFLLFAMVMLDAFYADLEKTTGSVANTLKEDKISTYYEYENEMRNVVISYINENNVDVSDGFVVSLDTLVNKEYIKPFYDLDDNSKCSGYIVVQKSNDNFSIEPNLICSNYRSENME